MKEAEMASIAGLVDRVLENPGDVETLDEIRAEVEALCQKFPLYEDRWNDRD
jgi:glycine/serine hydroxymethyltransferase